MPTLTRRPLDTLARPGAVALVSIGAAAAIAFAMTVGSSDGDAPVGQDLHGDAPSTSTAPDFPAFRDVAGLPALRVRRPTLASAPAVTPIPTATPPPVAPEPTPDAPPAPTPTPQPTFDLSG